MNREITITNIGKARVAGLIGLGLLLVVTLSTQAFTQTILIDGFNDGNDDGWERIDGTIGKTWSPGIFDASTGEYRLGSTGLITRGDLFDPIDDTYVTVPWEKSTDPLYSNGLYRWKFKITENATAVRLIMRGSVGNFYGFGAESFDVGNPGIFYFNRLDDGVFTHVLVVSEGEPHLGDEWMLEAGVVGDRLSMKWWPVGSPEPTEPQWEWIDPDPLPAGRIALNVFISQRGVNATGTPGPWRLGAIFDDLYFTFPEHDDVYGVSPYNIYLWESPMPVPQQEGPYFVAGSPEKPDMRRDVTKADDWPDLHLTGKVTDFNGKPIPGLKLDFWQTDDQGNYDNSGGYALRGHIYTDAEGSYELWTVVPAAYETVRTRHLHLKIGGVNLGFQSPVFTTQLYFPSPYDNDIDADGTPDKVIQGGFETNFDAIPLEEDYITLGDLTTIGAEFSDLAGNILTLNNDPAIDGYFDATLNIRMSDVFQAPKRTPNRILIDNFNDGNADGWTTNDKSIGELWGPGTFDTNSGAFHFEGAGLVPVNRWGFPSVLAAVWDQSSDPIFTDGFVRATVRATEGGTSVGIGLRYKSNPGPGIDYGYLFYAATAVNNRFGISTLPTVLETYTTGGPFFSLNEDWNIEAGSVGNQLSMKVWRVGDPEPESPQLMVTDTHYPPGTGQIVTMAWFDGRYNQPARVSGTFDNVYFTFPEHDDVYGISPYNAYLWESPMPVPQVEEPYFVAGSPNKTDMRGDVTKAEGWPDLHLIGKVTDLDGKPIPGLRLDFWQVDDKGNYDNSGGYALRGHIFTDDEGNYELWTIMPAAYDRFRTRKLHVKLGGLNLGFYSPVYTTQLYFPDPYDNDIDADGTPDKVIQDGVEMDSDAIGLEEDSIALVGLVAVDAESSDLASNTMTLNNDPAVDGYFDATLNIVLPQAFQVNKGN